jgi:ribose-phosphate pyrophosphokinase
MIIKKYPDGSTFASGISETLNNSVFRVNSYQDLWYLAQSVDAYYNYFKEKPTITIPNLIDAQADRRFNSYESFGLKLVCDFLNKMPANFKIFHPHNPEVVEALMDNVEIIDNSKFITQVLLQGLINHCPSILNKGINNDNLILMSSDAGGFKPLMKLCDKINWKGDVYSASKSRKLNDNSEFKLYQQIDRMDFGCKDILVIDDICVYGGTFKGIANLLKTRNVGKLYLAVSHMTVQNLGEDPISNYFDAIFTTNSKFNEYWFGTSEGIQQSIKNLNIINIF